MIFFIDEFREKKNQTSQSIPHLNKSVKKTEYFGKLQMIPRSSNMEISVYNLRISTDQLHQAERLQVKVNLKSKLPTNTVTCLAIAILDNDSIKQIYYGLQYHRKIRKRKRYR